jgi:hypothetical protein
MSYRVTVEERPGYLHARVTGENSPGAVAGYLAEVHAACVRSGCRALLIEEDLTGPGLGMAQIFKLASEGAERAIPDIDEIAYVDLNPEHSRADLHFAENVAGRRGLRVRLFATLAEAEHWLAAVAKPAR